MKRDEDGDGRRQKAQLLLRETEREQRMALTRRRQTTQGLDTGPCTNQPHHPRWRVPCLQAMAAQTDCTAAPHSNAARNPCAPPWQLA